MSPVPPSYEKVHYELRPAKQVERRMFIDAFQKLMSLGFAIGDYQYTGMGSVYFIDFILFHRYLGINRMVSVERVGKISRRLEFNKPFRFVQIIIGDVADQVCSLSPDRKHLLWLDYDKILDRNILSAVDLATSHLPAGSIFIVTVDAMPPGGEGDGPEKWKEHFEMEAGRYLWLNPRIEDFAKGKLASVNLRILKSVIANGLAGRVDVKFSPLFSFLYRDGHEMLTVGGMIAAESDRRALKQLDEKTLPYLRTRLSSRPFKIRVPLVTRKERLYLDSEMPCDDRWRPCAFEMKQKDVRDYCRIYRYYPAYGELLL